ncbi:hypothetical protein K450DRAFT_231021 [Umbelopsis ramanniana AG]|uniref:Uncharacterized protein n=1 Tax=Umbelopsis ramanniana AG TaxID=1314678 RepID=A0AAD5HH33_UMBRA|nr:uncharacterized protein K450DRAFT_231021 [Umbelopsis ramanniana AG]KAI8581763.1 hypothetical protein K450DRAFT_231021 [Umbelopsis ramanniana AG]
MSVPLSMVCVAECLGKGLSAKTSKVMFEIDSVSSTWKRWATIRMAITLKANENSLGWAKDMFHVESFLLLHLDAFLTTLPDSYCNMHNRIQTHSSIGNPEKKKKEEQQHR